MEMDFERRFGGVRRLYGEAAFKRFQEAHVCLVGVGGVGSWVAESLARSAIGHITLIDLDNIAESNTNRQVHALGDEYGKAKVTAMAQRIHAINPSCEVTEIEDFVTEDNLEAMLGRGYDFVVDAIDNGRVKAAMIHWCRRRKIKLITSGGAGVASILPESCSMICPAASRTLCFPACACFCAANSASRATRKRNSGWSAFFPPSP